MMLIGDGVTPGNEGRGYVLRRLLRRAVRSIRLLGYEDRALPELLPVSRDKMGETYGELLRDWERISTVAYAEEDAFRQTLRSGTTIFDNATTELKAGGATELSGDRAFALHDTYGFPIDLTLEMAAEQGLSVDEAGFRRLMDEQRDPREGGRARPRRACIATRRAYRAVADALGHAVEFTGYAETISEGSVAGLVTAGGVAPSAREGEDVELVLDRTPFYAEGGGQLADQGVIELENGARLEVRDVQSPVTGLIVHSVTVLSGEVTPGLRAQSQRRPDAPRRRSRARTPRPTWCTRRSARRWGRPPRRRARRTPPGGSASTSPRPARSRTRCWPMSSSGSTRSSSTTCSSRPR